LPRRLDLPIEPEFQFRLRRGDLKVIVMDSSELAAIDGDIAPVWSTKRLMVRTESSAAVSSSGRAENSVTDFFNFHHASRKSRIIG